MKTYKEALDYINEISRRGSVLGLSNMERLMAELGDVCKKTKIIHIAGTNGKGSVGAFIESVLIDNGYTVGRYVSPTIMTYLERFTVNGREISEETFVECLERVKTAAENSGAEPTAFEAETAVAFLALGGCDYLILEVGLGGRDDATNVIKSSYRSVITSISNDHSAILGDTLAKIAYQKAGIIKKGGYVISASQCAQVMAVIEDECEKQGAKLTVSHEPENIIFKNDSLYIDDIQINMIGEFQPQNAMLAVEVLKSMGISNIENGMKKARWRGRFEIISKNPLIIADGAHNEDAAQKLKRSLEKYYPDGEFVFIMGVLADKDYDKIVKITAPMAKQIYTVTPDNPRALDGEALAGEIRKYNKNVCAANIENALRACGKNDITVAFGSLSFLGDLIKTAGRINGKSK